jgi:hypothetical protein
MEVATVGLALNDGAAETPVDGACVDGVCVEAIARSMYAGVASAIGAEKQSCK